MPPPPDPPTSYLGLTDPALCARAREGDRDAVGELARRHRGLLKKTVNDIRLPNAVDKCDLEQAGYAALCRAAVTFDPGFGARFSTYLFRSARNAVFKEFRKHLACPIPIDPLAEGDPDDPDGGSPLAQLADHRGPAAPDLAPLLGRLPWLHRRVVELAYGLDGGKPVGSGLIGRRLGLTPHQARKVLDAALRGLQAIAADNPDLDPAPDLFRSTSAAAEAA